MNTKELECFLAVCEEKSLHKGADKMFISVQGMSRIIKKLEEEVGACVMNRTPQGIVLTPAGEILERHACNILENITNMGIEIEKRTKGFGGKLSVALSYGVLGYYQPSFIVDFKNEYPDIDLSFKEYTDSKAADSVWLGGNDLGVVYTPVDDEHFEQDPLNSSELFLVVHKNNILSGKDEVTIEDINGQNLVLQNEEFNINRLVSEESKKAGFTPNIVFQSTGICMCNRLCKENKGISVATADVIKEIKSDDVKLIPFKDRPYSMTISVITRKGGLITQEMEAFIHFMKDIAVQKEKKKKAV